MKITAKKPEDYTEKELRNERFEIISKLNDAGINPDLQKTHRKDKIKKIENHIYDLERIIAINELLGETGERNDMYKGFLNSTVGEHD